MKTRQQARRNASLEPSTPIHSSPSTTKPAATSSSSSDPWKVFLKLLELAMPIGFGRPASTPEEAHRHSKGELRSVLSHFVWTHIFLYVGVVVAHMNKVHDLAILTNISCTLSLVYHLRYEKPGLLAKLEGFSAKILLVYGIIQIPRAPLPALFNLEIALLCGVVLAFVITNINKKFYDPFHSLMHILPAIWLLFVAMYHKPLVALDLDFLY